MRPLVFITGASSGIGQALALRYHQAGWRLALVARRVPEMQVWLDAQGIPVEIAQCYGADVSDANSIIAAANACMAEQGVPDVVIANAGISIGMDTQVREDLDVLHQVMLTNVMGMAATFHPFLQAMKAQAANSSHPEKQVLWWVLPVWPAFAVCPVMRLIAPAKLPPSVTAKACAGNSKRKALKW